MYCLIVEVIIWREIFRKATQLQQSIAENSEARFGGVAQLGEHLPCKQGVRSSILLVSTIIWAYSSAG